MKERMLAPNLPAFFAKESRLFEFFVFFFLFFFFFFFATKSKVGDRQREKLVANGDLATGNFEHCLFYHGFFTGDCSKFCVKKMKSTVSDSIVLLSLVHRMPLKYLGNPVTCVLVL